MHFLNTFKEAFHLAKLSRSNSEQSQSHFPQLNVNSRILRKVNTMSSASTELKQELAFLTDDAMQTEKFLTQSQGICSISTTGPRWFSLSSYKDAQNSWSWEEELKKCVFDMAMDEGMSDLELSNEIGGVEANSTTESRESLNGTFLEESNENPLPELEKARMRVLATLESYKHNLEEGNLVTRESVDEGVAEALQKLVALADGKSVINLESKGIFEGTFEDACEKSDEEGVIFELESYLRQVVGSGAVVEKDVAEVAKGILEWERRKRCEGLCELQT
jgi:hypothetical protein